MTRLRFAVLAVAFLAAACAAPEGGNTAASPPPPAPAAPFAVHVAVPEGASEDVAQWAAELEAAIKTRAGDLVLVPDPSAAALVVRILSAEKGAEQGVQAPGVGESMVMRFALVAGDASRDLSLTYRGDPRPQAEALARNLRRLGDEVRKGAAPVAATAAP